MRRPSACCSRTRMKTYTRHSVEIPSILRGTTPFPRYDNSLSPEIYFDHFATWLRAEMPRLNMRILAKEMDHDILRDQVQYLVDAFPAIEKLTHAHKVQAIQYFGFAVSSIERHSQDRGHPSGQGLARIKGIEPLLLALGEQTGYPPRDTFYTFSTINRPNSITFSGDSQEELFIDVLNRSSDLLRMAGDLIRPITRGQMSMDEPQATQALIGATYALEDARQQFLRYMEVVDPQTGQFALSMPFFRDVFRQFTCDWFIGGQEWTGASAADAVEFKKIDYLIGTTNDHFRHYALERMRYLPPHQKAELVDDMQSLSLLDVVILALSLAPQAFASLSETDIAARLKRQSQQDLQFIHHYIKLAGMSGRLSATHWSLLANYLIKPTQAGQGTGLKGDECGTAHINFGDISAMRDMRRLHPQVKKISSALGNLL